MTAQVAINSTGAAPDASSMLDITSSNTGVLIPRVALDNTSTTAPISNPANGLMIFNATGTQPKGFYFWSADDTEWKQLYSGKVPTIPGNTEFWIRPDGEHYIRPEYNANARVFDAGQNWGFYYEGTNKHGAFFAGDDVGIIGQRAGTDTTFVPSFIDDDYPFSDINSDAAITSDDEVTYSGVYGYGKLYVGITGIAKWDAGVRGIGLATYEDFYGTYYDLGTNSSWPVVGVLGEVLDIGSDLYGQQGIYGWQAAPAGTAEYCQGVLGRTSQSGYASGGLAGYYTDAVGNLTEAFNVTAGTYYNYGLVGVDNYGVYAYAQTGDAYGKGKSTLNNSAIVGVCNQDENYSYISGSGASLTGTTVGVYGTAITDKNPIGALFENNKGSYVLLATNQNGINYKIAGNGQIATFVENPVTKKTVSMFSSVTPEILLQDFGYGKLNNGKAHIDLDAVFSENIFADDKHPIKIFVQLEGDCNGVYVTNKTKKGFDVIELKNGNSNVKFSWFVSANRADSKNDKGNIISKNSNARYPSAPNSSNDLKIDVNNSSNKINKETDKMIKIEK